MVFQVRAAFRVDLSTVESFGSNEDEDEVELDEADGRMAEVEVGNGGEVELIHWFESEDDCRAAGSGNISLRSTKCKS